MEPEKPPKSPEQRTSVSPPIEATTQTDDKRGSTSSNRFAAVHRAMTAPPIRRVPTREKEKMPEPAPKAIAGPILKPLDHKGKEKTLKIDIESSDDDTKPRPKVAPPAKKPSEDEILLDEAKGIDKPDFVLVYDKSKVTAQGYEKIESFASNLERKGLKLKCDPFSINEDLIFIKIYGKRSTLIHYAEVMGVELAFKDMDFKPSTTVDHKFMATDLTVPNRHSDIYRRASETMSSGRPKTITTAEKGLVIYHMLRWNPFGEDPFDYGIDKLLAMGVIKTCYPLHDGPAEWTDKGPLNDRQLLKRYWSSLKCWHKQQPLDTIEKYFGSEFSFYFAFVGFYNAMLISASIFGIVCFFLGLFIWAESFRTITKDVCESNLYLCPRCKSHKCKFEKFSSACWDVYFMRLFDNSITIINAAFVSVWATVFLQMWRRKQTMLQLRWSLMGVEVDISTRPGFEDNTKYRRVSPISQVEEAYVPKKVQALRYVITISFTVFMAILVTLVVIGVIVYRIVVAVVLQDSHDEIVSYYGPLIAMITGSLVSLVVIVTFEMFYHILAMWLTNLENPRTQFDFDKSYAYKIYAMAFTNNYSLSLYIAFFKGKFYTHPGDPNMWNRFGGIGADQCGPTGCMNELGVQIIIIMTLKTLFMTAAQYIIPKFVVVFNRFWTGRRQHSEGKRHFHGAELTAQWELDYTLNEVNARHLINEYIQMLIQFGFVVFFIAVFPLAPFLALLNNLVELRVDAYKVTDTYRRPVAFKVPNLGAWNGILEAATYIGICTNAMMVAFTSMVVDRSMYRFGHDKSLRGFINTTISAFKIDDFTLKFDYLPPGTDVCYYTGKRNPPDHPKKYELVEWYWYDVMVKFLVVLVVEHFLMILTGIISLSISEIPFSVKEQLNQTKEKIKNLKIKELNSRYMQRHRRRINLVQKMDALAKMQHNPDAKDT